MSEKKVKEIDERFAKAKTDLRFRRAPSSQRKIQVDSRFEKMFTDKAFTNPVKIDKYGRKIEAKKGDDMRRFYALENDSESSKPRKPSKKAAEKSESASEDEESGATYRNKLPPLP